MRISDWSSDVCSSDLHARLPERPAGVLRGQGRGGRCPRQRAARSAEAGEAGRQAAGAARQRGRGARRRARHGRSDERSVGKECVVRVDLGGRRIIKKKKTIKRQNKKKCANQET